MSPGMTYRVEAPLWNRVIFEVTVLKLCIKHVACLRQWSCGGGSRNEYRLCLLPEKHLASCLQWRDRCGDGRHLVLDFVCCV